jgi:hypothetical protein
LEYDEAGKVLAELVFDDLAAIKLPTAAKGRRVIRPGVTTRRVDRDRERR